MEVITLDMLIHQIIRHYLKIENILIAFGSDILYEQSEDLEPEEINIYQKRCELSLPSLNVRSRSILLVEGPSVKAYI